MARAVEVAEGKSARATGIVGRLETSRAPDDVERETEVEAGARNVVAVEMVCVVARGVEAALRRGVDR